MPRSRCWFAPGVVTAAGEPASVSEAFVTNQTDDTLSIVELGDLKALRRFQNRRQAGRHRHVAPMASSPSSPSPDGKELVVVDAARAQDRAADQGRRRRPSASPRIRATAAVYVADWYTHKVSVVDPWPERSLAEIAVGRFSVGLAVTPDGRLLLTADRDSNAVSIIDTETNDADSAAVTVGEPPVRHHDRCRRQARLHRQRRQRRRERDRHRRARKVIAHRDRSAGAPMPWRSPAAAPSSPTSTPARSASSTSTASKVVQADRRSAIIPRASQPIPAGTIRLRRLLVRQRSACASIPPSWRVDGRGRGRRRSAGIWPVSALRAADAVPKPARPS